MTLDELCVAKILERAEHYDWSLQGLGMLRLYLSSRVRLHVWDRRFAVENVSTIHDHPWHFESIVLVGSIRNRVFRVVPGEPTHHGQTIVCGPGGGPAEGWRADVRLELARERTIYPGTFCNGEREGYRMEAPELHESVAEDGTVTIIEREPLPDAEHARVFFPLGTEWVSAEPRRATTDEIRAICAHALAKLREPLMAERVA